MSPDRAGAFHRHLSVSQHDTYPRYLVSLQSQLTTEVDRLLFIFSENEAKMFGRFLCEVLGNLSRWHGNRALYESEGRGANLPGFQRRWAPPNSEGEDEYLDFEGFRLALYRWHTMLYKVSLCLL